MKRKSEIDLLLLLRERFSSFPFSQQEKTTRTRFAGGFFFHQKSVTHIFQVASMSARCVCV